MIKGERKRLVLFDAHAIIHRAYHALPDFSTKEGTPTGGLYGLTMMLLKSVELLKPDYMVACYDLPGQTFRHKEYDAYKAGRAKADDALVAQLRSSREVFQAFNVPIYDAPGFEADDMLGTIIEATKDIEDLEVVVVTGDMDSLQLVSGDRVRVFTLRKGINDTIIYDEDAVRERFGFGPELLPDYKGFRGDPSDNIIGIKGIGEKTASELLTKFGDMDEIYRSLKSDVQSFKNAGIKDRIITLLIEGEDDARFSKMLATIRRDAPIKFTLPEQTWRVSLDVDRVLALMEQLEFRSIKARVERDFKIEEESDGGKIGNSNESDEQQIEQDPQEVKKLGIALWLVDSDKTTPNEEDIYEYAGTRSFAKAKEIILGALHQAGLQHVYEEIELPLVSIIARAEQHGVLTDVEFLNNVSLEYHKKLDAITASIYELAGKEFNLNSPKQLGEVLFDEMKLTAKGLKKTEGGARSTRESELEKLRDAHPIIEKILEYREVQKLLSTYIDTIPRMVDAEHRLHTTLHQTGTTTGRMSSSNPNLQNIPVREGLGAHLRNAFIAPKGNILLACDYAQIEMRVLAMLSRDPGLIEILREGTDVHTSVASRVFRVPPNEVTKEMRRRAKVINFGIVYGMGVTALKTNLNSTREEAQAFYDQYFVTFPKIANYFEELKREAARLGYTTTLFGRKRQFKEIRSKIPYIKAQAERMVMNAPIQGTAADFVKIAMREVDHMLEREGLRKFVTLILQVHDELIFEIEDKKEVLERVVPRIVETMESVTKFANESEIKLSVEPQIGKRWGELEDLNLG